MLIVFRDASLLLEWLRMVCCHYTVRERPLEAEISIKILFVLACDTALCAERETSNAILNAADRKFYRGTESHSHSFH